jgi:putative transposase
MACPALLALLAAIRSLLWSRAQFLALRHQLLVLKRQCAGRRVHFQTSERVLWSWLSQLWPGWRQGLLLVRPETVVRWHRQGFRLYWRWKSRSRSLGRPPIEAEIRDLIIEMHRANPTWGAPRIHGELFKLGFTSAQSTVSKYLPRRRKPPSQSWRTFLRNHLREAIAIFAVVSPVRFGLLYVFVVLSLERRRLLHVHVTAHPTAA